MARPTASQPTQLELKLLTCLWEQGACTAKRLQEAVNDGMSASSVHIALKNMLRKKYIRRIKRGYREGALFEPAISREGTGVGMIRYVIQTIFGGSIKPAMLSLLDRDEISEGEIAELKKLLRQRARGKKT